MPGHHKKPTSTIGDGLVGWLGRAAHLRDLGRSRRDLAVPDPQIAVRWAEDTCSPAVGSGDHAGAVGGHAGGTRRVNRGCCRIGRKYRWDSTLGSFRGCPLKNGRIRRAATLGIQRASGAEATGEV